jgi:hypothetical protein
MNKKVLGIVLPLSLTFIFLVTSVAPALATVTYYDHVSASGNVVINIAGHQPQFTILAGHINKGDHAVADYLEVDFLTDIGLPIGPVWIPFLVVTDNPSMYAFNKNFIYAGINPAAVVQLVKNCQLEVCSIGKTVLVCWTVPLVTPAITVPPGCLLLNGYGCAKTEQFIYPIPNGVTLTINGKADFAVHATFLCPAWKYFGSVGDQNTYVSIDSDWLATK